MKTFAALLRRELGVYFVSPLAYIILTALLFISGLGFAGSVAGAVAARAPGDYQGTVMFIDIVITLTAPLVTMRLIAEEKSKGTIEILLTAPVRELEVVLAKFASSLALLAFLLIPTLGFAFILGRYESVDYGQVFCAYLGVLLLGGALYSAGLFISSLCTSQITAGVITFMVMILLVSANLFAINQPETSVVRQVLDYVSLTANFGDFLKGIVDTSRLVYLLSISGFFLFLTTRILETRRWR